MTRDQIITSTSVIPNRELLEQDDNLLVNKLIREVTHGYYVDLCFKDMRGLSDEVLLDEASDNAIDFMQLLAADAPLPEVYRIHLMKREPAMTRHDMAQAVADLRSDAFDMDERVEKLRRLVDDAPHAEIGDLIYRDTQGLTPAEVVDEAIRRQVAHLRSLFKEGDPRRQTG